MEAATLKGKKKIKKGKLRKSMKTIICRPDPTFWPQTSESEAKGLIDELNELKVDIPPFKKPLWKELTQIPKELRPKPPPIPKVEGLIFGIAQCQKAIEAKEIAGILIEAGVNPKTIVQPMIETCSTNTIPVLCLTELRNVTKTSFGIPTIALGVKENYFPDLVNRILQIYKSHKPVPDISSANIVEEMDQTTDPNETEEMNREFVPCPYLYRIMKTSRTFSPIIAAEMAERDRLGKDYVRIPKVRPPVSENMRYKKMFLKKISNNPNRKVTRKLSLK